MNSAKLKSILSIIFIYFIFESTVIYSEKIYCDSVSMNAKKIFSSYGFSLTSSIREADLVWVRLSHIGIQEKLVPGQIFNHIPNETTMISKENLAKHLCNDSFHPQTFDLLNEEELQDFYACLNDINERETLWIFKPTNQARGKGIRILTQKEALKNFSYQKKLQLPDWINHKRPYIVQRYISNPLLLNGRKSEIRIYWLIASLDPLLVLMYPEGTVRLNTLPFKLAEYNNPLIHITNVYRQKHHPDFDPSIELKWDFSQFETYLIKTHPDLVSPGYMKQTLQPKIKQCLKKVVESVESKLKDDVNSNDYFGFYGADLILDDQLNPWLTEIQVGPGLSHIGDPVKEKIIPNMLGNAIQIIFDIQQRRRDKAALKDLNTRGYEWIIKKS